MCIEYVNVLETVVRADFDRVRDVPFFNWNNEKWDKEGPWTLKVWRDRYLEPATFHISRDRERQEKPPWADKPYTNNYQDWLLDWKVWSMPGLIIISGAAVNQHYQGKGLGKMAAEWRVRAYDILLEQEPCHKGKLDLICRVNAENKIEHHILRDVGWMQLNREDMLVPTTIWAYRPNDGWHAPEERKEGVNH